MGNVIFDISTSLDGFIAASGMTSAEGMGVGGEVLHNWAFAGNEQDRELLENAAGSLGAVITGRRTFDNSIRWWGADGPTGPARVPVFVVSHSFPADLPDDGVYTFVDGTRPALDAARAAAGDAEVGIMGGADIGRQYLDAGLVDEISLHLVPVLLGSGTPLWGDGAWSDEHLPLSAPAVVATPAATHLRFSVAGELRE